MPRNLIAHRAAAGRGYPLAVQTMEPGSVRATPVDEAMQHAVDEAARLLRADGAFIDLVDPASGRLRWAYVAGITDDEDRLLLSDLELAPGSGLFGRAVAEQQVLATGDYLADPRFVHTAGTDRFARKVGIRSVIAAPLLGDDGPLGVLGVYAAGAGAFDDRHLAVVRALADHAAARITTAHLIDDLAAARDEQTRRVDVERTLRHISARIIGLADLEDLLQDVVEEARRLAKSDGAQLTLTAEDGSHLEPFVATGAVDTETRAWLRSLRLEAGSGINALAWIAGLPVWTSDLRVDRRLPHGESDGAAARRLQMIAIASAPMRGPDWSVIGTLAISFAEPHAFTADEIELLQALGDQAALAVLNSRLYEQLRASEARLRLLVQSAPDLIFAVDAEGRLTFVSETAERITGWRPDELVGRQFTSFVAPGSGPDIRRMWQQMVDGAEEVQLRIDQIRRDGSTIRVEVHASPTYADGRFNGLQGSARDLSELDELESNRRVQTAELAVAAERANVARELHDSVTQALFSMTLTTRTVELLLERGRVDAARERLDELRSLQKDALAEMRALIHALRPRSGDTAAAGDGDPPPQRDIAPGMPA